MKFGRLTPIYRDKDRVQPSGYKEVMWRCVCDCGNEVSVRSKLLLQGITKSCGCLVKERMSKKASKHHGFGTRLYSIWDSMRQRCNNPNCSAYKNYGGRGISICDEWDDFAVFREWALANGYDELAERGTYTLDRIDVNGDYAPDNCRWVNFRTQSNNKRDTIYVEYDGMSMPLSYWAETTGIKYCTLFARYKRGWSPERILSPI